jgi:fatty-acyl-CoA synthase
MSGTTGNPKGATLSHHNILNNGYMQLRQRITEKTKSLYRSPLPLFGIRNFCVSQGQPWFTRETFDAEATLKAVSEEKQPHLWGAHYVFCWVRSSDLKQYDLNGCEQELWQDRSVLQNWWRKCKPKCIRIEMEIGYGMTETSPLSTQTRHDAPFDKRVSTVGEFYRIPK